jgi:hypothetical protein
MLARKNVVTGEHIIQEVPDKVKDTGRRPSKFYTFEAEPNTVFQSTVF